MTDGYDSGWRLILIPTFHGFWFQWIDTLQADEDEADAQ